MERIRVNGLELAVEARGSGEPVVLVHGSVVADSAMPLLGEAALVNRYRVIAYHRIGYGESDRAAGPVSIVEQAQHCRAVLAELGAESAHVVGHSYGGVIALQLALEAPEVVGTLALLEPALLAVPSGEQFGEAMGPVVERYQAGDRAGAVDGFMRGALDPNYRSWLERALPGAFERAVADADTFFAVELPALRGWTFTAEDARRIDRPVLAVLGGESGPLFRDGHELLAQWFPRAERARLPNVHHALQMQDAPGLSEILVGFLGRHPLHAGPA